MVVDPSVVVAARVDSGPDGEWAAGTLRGHALAAPHHLPIEAADVLRRAVLAGDLSSDGDKLVRWLCALEFVARNGGTWVHPVDDPEGDEAVAMIEGVAAGPIGSGVGRWVLEACWDVAVGV